MIGEVRVLAFDLDDTLSVSKSPIDPRMAGLVERLLAKSADQRPGPARRM